MTDYVWPDDLVPYASGFYLQAHSGGSESPFSRQSKVYGLGAPRWVCSVALRVGRGTRWGAGPHVIAGRVDALISRLKGRENRIAIWDFDFPEPRGGLVNPVGNAAALAGDATITITGLLPGALIYSGDYFGGDGRPHMIVNDTFDDVAAVADASGNATVSFEPPLSANIALNAATFGKVTAMFRLASGNSDDAGSNTNEAGQLVSYALQFVEDL